MQTSMIKMDRTNYHTYLFVGLCWLLPITFLSMTVGPVQWVFQWADTHHWNPEYRTYSLYSVLGLLILTTVYLTQHSARFLINAQYYNAPIHKGMWIFLTLSSIASVSWLIINPERFAAIDQMLAYANP